MHLITVEVLQQACHHTSQSRGHGLSACQPAIYIPHPVCPTTWTLTVEIMQIAFPWRCLSLSEGGGSLHVCAALFVFRIQGRVSARANANDTFKVQIITWAHPHTMQRRYNSCSYLCSIYVYYRCNLSKNVYTVDLTLI